MQKLLDQLKEKLPDVSFVAGKTFHWSPADRAITYRHTAAPTVYDRWALIHEAGHAALGHTAYHSDLQLLLMEVAAWDKALELAKELNVSIDNDHVQDCLDTYRDWLHQRSTCPACSTTCLQIDSDRYRCHNCNTEWRVTTSRFCRAYRRRQLSSKQKRSHELPQATFM